MHLTDLADESNLSRGFFLMSVECDDDRQSKEAERQQNRNQQDEFHNRESKLEEAILMKRLASIK